MLTKITIVCNNSKNDKVKTFNHQKKGLKPSLIDVHIAAISSLFLLVFLQKTNYYNRLKVLLTPLMNSITPWIRYNCPRMAPNSMHNIDDQLTQMWLLLVFCFYSFCQMLRSSPTLGAAAIGLNYWWGSSIVYSWLQEWLKGCCHDWISASYHSMPKHYFSLSSFIFISLSFLFFSSFLSFSLIFFYSFLFFSLSFSSPDYFNPSTFSSPW